MKIETPTEKQYRLNEYYYSKMGLKKIEGRLYNIYNLPDNLTVSSDLDLWDNNLTSLPEGLEVGGDLYLSYNKFTSLPKGLKVGENLNLTHNNLKSLPEDLKVGGNLYLWKNNFPKGYKIPDTVEIDGEVYGL